MTESICSKCKDEFEPEEHERICGDCQDELDDKRGYSLREDWLDVPWHSSHEKARQAWFAAANASGNWQVALRPNPGNPHDKNAVEIVETELGALIGYIPAKLARTWSSKIAAFVARERACPLVDARSNARNLSISWPPHLASRTLRDSGQSAPAATQKKKRRWFS